MEEEISQELIKSITSKIEDDIIKQASFLLFSLVMKYPSDSSLKVAAGFLKSKGWLLKTEDRLFMENISHKSLIDIEKWIDFNLIKIR
jgi:hypothetical protein